MAYFGDGSNLTGITASQISGSLGGACASGGGSGSTDQTSYQNVVSVTITPTQSNSYMLIMATGVVQGRAGNNSNNSSTGYAQVTRDTTQIGSEITVINDYLLPFDERHRVYCHPSSYENIVRHNLPYHP